MAFISKARSKQFRKKPSLSLDPQDDEDDTPKPADDTTAQQDAPPKEDAPPKASAPSAAQKPTATKKALKPTTSLLSFDDDDPGALGISTTKSKKDRKQKEGGRRPLKVPGLTAPEDDASVNINTQVSAHGEYSRERLQELARANKKLPSVGNATHSGGSMGGGGGTAAAAPAGGAFTLAGSFKPPAAARGGGMGGTVAVEDDRFAYNPAALVWACVWCVLCLCIVHTLQLHCVDGYQHASHHDVTPRYHTKMSDQEISHHGRMHAHTHS